MAHVTAVPAVEILTDRVMNWFGFDQAYNYPLRPYAMIVACDLYANGVTPDTLTHADIQTADARNDGRLSAMFAEMHPTRRIAIAVRRPVKP